MVNISSMLKVNARYLHLPGKIPIIKPQSALSDLFNFSILTEIKVYSSERQSWRFSRH